MLSYTLQTSKHEIFTKSHRPYSGLGDYPDMDIVHRDCASVCFAQFTPA